MYRFTGIHVYCTGKFHISTRYEKIDIKWNVARRYHDSGDNDGKGCHCYFSQSLIIYCTTTILRWQYIAVIRTDTIRIE